jgi:hypothetical protein
LCAKTSAESTIPECPAVLGEEPLGMGVWRAWRKSWSMPWIPVISVIKIFVLGLGGGQDLPLTCPWIDLQRAARIPWLHSTIDWIWSEPLWRNKNLKYRRTRTSVEIKGRQKENSESKKRRKLLSSIKHGSCKTPENSPTFPRPELSEYTICTECDVQLILGYGGSSRSPSSEL